MTETAAPPDLATWLTSRTDTELVGLLTLRPDLTVPPPSTIEVLAGRAEQRASILRSADSLDTLALTILELLSIEGAHEIPVTRAQLDSGVSGRASVKAVDAALTALRLAVEEQAEEAMRLETLRNAFEARVLAQIAEVRVNGGAAPRSPRLRAGRARGN